MDTNALAIVLTVITPLLLFLMLSATWWRINMYLDQYWRHSAVEVNTCSIAWRSWLRSQAGTGSFLCGDCVLSPCLRSLRCCKANVNAFTHVHSGSTEDLKNRGWREFQLLIDMVWSQVAVFIISLLFSEKPQNWASDLCFWLRV